MLHSSTLPFGLFLPHYDPFPTHSVSFASSLLFPLSPRLSPAGWGGLCPRKWLTWGEHQRGVKLTFYCITDIETPVAAAVLNVIQRVNTAPPGRKQLEHQQHQQTIKHYLWSTRSYCLFDIFYVFKTVTVICNACIISLPLYLWGYSIMPWNRSEKAAERAPPGGWMCLLSMEIHSGENSGEKKTTATTSKIVCLCNCGVFSPFELSFWWLKLFPILHKAR